MFISRRFRHFLLHTFSSYLLQLHVDSGQRAAISVGKGRPSSPQLLLNTLTHFRTAWENPSSGSITRAALTRCPQQPQLGSLHEEEQNPSLPHPSFKAELSYPEKEIHQFLRSFSQTRPEDTWPPYDLKWTIHPFPIARPQNSLSVSNDPRTSWRSQFD